MMSSSGKSAATSSTAIGLEYFSRTPPPPGMPGADAGRAGVKQRDQPGLGDHLVQRVERAVVGPERLRVGVELEARGRPPRSARGPRGRRACPCAGRRSRTGSARPGSRARPPAPRRCPAARRPMPASSSTVKTTASDVAFAVVVGDLLRGRLRRVAAEVLRRRRRGARRSPGPAAGSSLRSACDVNVDGDEPVDVDRHAVRRHRRGRAGAAEAAGSAASRRGCLPLGRDRLRRPSRHRGRPRRSPPGASRQGEPVATDARSPAR